MLKPIDKFFPDALSVSPDGDPPLPWGEARGAAEVSKPARGTPFGRAVTALKP